MVKRDISLQVVLNHQIIHNHAQKVGIVLHQRREGREEEEGGAMMAFVTPHLEEPEDVPELVSSEDSEDSSFEDEETCRYIDATAFDEKEVLSFVINSKSNNFSSIAEEKHLAEREETTLPSVVTEAEYQKIKMAEGILWTRSHQETNHQSMMRMQKRNHSGRTETVWTLWKFKKVISPKSSLTPIM